MPATEIPTEIDHGGSFVLDRKTGKRTLQHVTIEATEAKNTDSDDDGTATSKEHNSASGG